MGITGKGWIEEGEDEPGSCTGLGPQAYAFLRSPGSPRGEIKWDLE